jgi:beta-galactosidase
MKKIAGLCALLVLTTYCSRADNAAVGPRQRLCMDLNWTFTRGDPDGAQNQAFDDTGWRVLDVPHDWSIEGPFAQTNSTGGSGGSLPAGIGWYRKHFVTPASFKGKKVSVEFEGVFMNSDVYLNGQKAGHHAYGYASFNLDLTPYLAAAGADNVLAVRVDNSTQPNSRFYTGSGIYRHVWADVTGPVYLATWGTAITTPKASGESADVIIKTRVQNETDAAARVGVRQEIIDAAGKTVGSMDGSVEVPAKGQQELTLTVSVPQPQLWTLDKPSLYTARTSLTRSQAGANLEIIDSYDTPIGIRQIDYDVEKGFLLNGKPVKMLGMCVHEDGGALGMAAPPEIWERRLRVLKGMGCNSIRCSHNPPAPEFLDLSDRLGLLVMDEAFDEWTVTKGRLNGSYSTLFNEWSQRDLISMLQRDRNHPSIVMWSIGNEIPQQSTQLGVQIARTLAGICHAEDPSRPVTSACDNVHAPNPTLPEFLDALDIAGYNYVDRWGKYREIYFADDHDKYPQRKFVGTEDVGVGGVRGNYFGGGRGGFGGGFGGNFGTNAGTSFGGGRGGFGGGRGGGAFGYASSMIRAEQLWKFNAVHDYVIGYFMWTGVDYLGEAGWPNKAAGSGVLDTCGFPKDGYYFYQSQWTAQPMVHVFPTWNYPGEKGVIIPVVVYSNCRQVELLVNGKSYGTKSLVFPRPGATRSWSDFTPAGTTADLHLTWDVPYEPGIIRVLGRQDGQEIVAQEEIHTPGAPARIALNLDKSVLESAGRGVAQVEVRILDADGNLVPTARNVVSFDIHGPANIIGYDNGDNASHDSYQTNSRPVFNGLALAAVRAGKTPGQVTVTAKAEGLKEAAVELEVQAGTPVASLP